MKFRATYIITTALLSLYPVKAICEELFYENCVDGKCQNRYLVGKEKVADGHYKAKVMFVDYRGKNTAEVDEHYKIADVICDKTKPSAGWRNSKSQNIDKNIFSDKASKKGNKSSDDAPKKYDELTSLWKKICH